MSEKGYVSELFVSFQGEGARAGERHLFVRMAICNLRCRYCDTLESLGRVPDFAVHNGSSVPHRVQNPVGPDALIRHANALLEKQGPVDAIALTGGEPLLQASFLASFLGHARFRVPVLLETNGVLPDGLLAVLPWVTVISMDIKAPSNTGETAFWNEHEEFLRNTRGKDVYIKLVVDRGTAAEDVAHAAKLAASAPGGPLLYLQPILDVAGNPQIDYPTLLHFYGIARCLHGAVRVLPQVHKILGIR